MPMRIESVFPWSSTVYNFGFNEPTTIYLNKKNVFIEPYMVVKPAIRS